MKKLSIVASLGLLIGINAVVALLRSRFSGFRRFVEGVPVMLISHGDIQYRALKKEHLTMDDLMASLRAHEVTDPSKCELMMLENDGSVSVLRKESPEDPTRLIRTRKKLIRHHKRPNDGM